MDNRNTNTGAISQERLDFIVKWVKRNEKLYSKNSIKFKIKEDGTYYWV